MLESAGAIRTRQSLTNLLLELDWRGELLTFCLIVAETAIAYLFLGLLVPTLNTPYTPFPAWLLFALFIVGYYLPHGLELGRVWGSVYEMCLILALILSFLVTVKIASFPGEPLLSTAWLQGTVHGLILRQTSAARSIWAIIAVVAYTWWRGRLRGEPMMDSAYQMLRWGTAAISVGLVLVLMAAPEEALIRDRMSVAVIVFFTSALCAIAVARLRLEGLRSGSPLGPRWFATFVTSIAGILLVAVVAAAIFSRRFLDTMLLILSPILLVIGLVVRVIIILIALLAFVIIAPLLWLLQREGFGSLSSSLRIPIVFRSFNGFQQFTSTRLNIADPLRYLIVGLILFGIVTSLTRFVYHRRRHWRDTAVERREPVKTLGEAVGSISLNLRRFFRPLRRDDSLAKLRGDPYWAHTVTIRETYRRMQRWGTKGGVEQGPSTTATEYEPDLARRFPNAGPAIRTIIAAYTVARYSGIPATADEANEVRRAWETLRKLKVS